MTRSLPQLALAAALLLSCATGCRKAEIRIYEAPKSNLDALLAAVSDRTASQVEAVWTAPVVWQELPATPLHRANYGFTGADGATVRISVSALHLPTGTALYRLANEVRDEEGLTPLPEQRLEQFIVTSRENARVVRRLNMPIPVSKENPKRLVAASIVGEGGPIWLFSLYGPAAVVQSQLENFEAFVGSVTFSVPQSESSRAQARVERLRLFYDAPEDWTKIENSTHREGGFKIHREGLPDARLTISSFPGDAGGLAANINRWRRQIGLDEWQADTVPNRAAYFNSNGLRFLLYDLKADNDEESARTNERILAAVLEDRGRTWFLKLRGDRFLLETQRNNFRQFLRSIRIGPATEAAPAKPNAL